MAAQENQAKILILATEDCAYPGANAVGQAHMSYPENSYVMRVRAPVMFPEQFYLDCFKKGIYGIIISHPRGQSVRHDARTGPGPSQASSHRSLHRLHQSLCQGSEPDERAYNRVGASRGRERRKERRMSTNKIEFDALVMGGGIAGLQTALDLADQDFKVAIVEQDATIGGKMIRLAKVFPTLDCASCITTPKMSAAAHHPNITIFTYCELQSLKRTGGEITARVTQKPRFVDEIKCIGCRQCEYACPVYVPDEEQGGFAARKAICVPFSTAIPQVALMDVENCTLCGKCAKVCPTDAVDYFQKPDDFTLTAKTAIIATGFDYEQFYQNSKAMGVEFIKGKVATIDPGENGSVTLHYEDQGADGGVKTAEHDLVVLSLGMVAGWNPEGVCNLSTGNDAFIKTIRGFRGGRSSRTQRHRGFDC